MEAFTVNGGEEMLEYALVFIGGLVVGFLVRELIRRYTGDTSVFNIETVIGVVAELVLEAETKVGGRDAAINYVVTKMTEIYPKVDSKVVRIVAGVILSAIASARVRDGVAARK